MSFHPGAGLRPRPCSMSPLTNSGGRDPDGLARKEESEGKSGPAPPRDQRPVGPVVTHRAQGPCPAGRVGGERGLPLLRRPSGGEGGRVGIFEQVRVGSHARVHERGTGCGSPLDVSGLSVSVHVSSVSPGPQDGTPSLFPVPDAVLSDLGYYFTLVVDGLRPAPRSRNPC